MARDYLIKSCVNDSVKHLNMLYKCECCLPVNMIESGGNNTLTFSNRFILVSLFVPCHQMNHKVFNLAVRVYVGRVILAGLAVRVLVDN